MIVTRTPNGGPRVEPPREHLDRLARRLDTYGFETELGRSRTGAPLLCVTNPARPGLLCETVACVADADGPLRYVWPWGAAIATVGDLPGAVAEIRRVLGGGRHE